MKNKLWNSKNYLGGRTFVNKEIHNYKKTLIMGQRSAILSQCANESTLSSNEDPCPEKHQTKFDVLKGQIKNLENSQFLSMKYRCNTEPDNFEDVQFRLTGKEFMPSKKIAQLERYKMHLRTKGKKRKISLLLQRNRVEEGKECSMVNMLEAKDININNRESNLKKKETPSIVRKYYRPQSGPSHRSMSELYLKENRQTEVRGRGLKSSVGSRGGQKQNIVIYCY